MDTTSSLKSVGRALRHHHRAVWGTALAAAVLAFGATFVRHPTYEATTVLSLDETQTTSQGFDIAMQADQFLTQRFISRATSRPVLEQVCAIEGLRCDPVELSRHVRATTPKATGQIAITADSSSASQAARLANDVSNELVKLNQAQIDEALAPQRTYLDTQLKQLQDRINSTQASIAAAEGSGRSDAAVSNAISPLISQLNLLQAQYTSTYTRRQDLDVLQAREASTLSIYEPALVPAKPVDPNPVRYVLVGLLGGLVGGFLIALLAERFRDRIGDTAELAEATDTHLILDLSRGRAAAAAGTYGYLAQASLVAGEDRAPAIMLVSASPRDDVDEIAVNLAEAVSSTHHKVLVIQARQRALDAPQRREIVATNGSSRIVVQAGAEGTGRNGRVAVDGFDLVIMCALPPMADHRGTWLRPAANVAIIVASRDRTRFSEARQTVDQLHHIGIETVGAVLLPRRTSARPRLLEAPAREPESPDDGTRTREGTEDSAVEPKPEEKGTGGSEPAEPVQNGATPSDT